MHSFSTRLDGTGDRLDADGFCPIEQDFDAIEPLALGCGGSIVVSFSDESGAPIELAAGHSVEVLEYGEECGGSASDEYNVSLCQNTAAVDAGSIASCIALQNHTTLSGLATVTLTMPEL